MTLPVRPKPIPRRLNVGVVAGIAVAFGCIVAGLIVEGGSLSDLTQAAAAIIVTGGTLGAVLITTPFRTFRAALRRSVELVATRRPAFEHTFSEIVFFAEGVRRNGLASLEDFALRVEDPFFAKALNLAADGAEPAQIREIMALDAACEQEIVESEAGVWESAAGYAPTIGIIGAVLGLIQVMKHLENLDEVGRGIAVAFVATVYGVALANLILIPIAGRLRARNIEVASLHEMMLEGTIAIAEGLNPSLIRIKLGPFVGCARATGGSKPTSRTMPRAVGPVPIAS